MRKLKISWLFLLAATLFSFTLAGVAHAQDVHILYPKEGQDVRGEITARFEGIPSGGYALVTVDGQFRQATAQDSIVFDTISDRTTFARGDSAYRLEITVLNAGGKRVGTDAVTFNVANQKVEVAGASVKLVHWSPSDRLGSVQRYRVFAESNATMSGGTTGAGGGGVAAPSAPGEAAGAGGGASVVADTIIPAPLDWQLSALMRRVVRDTGLLSDSANISTIVQEAFERQRQGGGSGTGDAVGAVGATPTTNSRKKVGLSSGPHKAPWNQDDNGNPIWNPASETGKYFIKMIQQDGTEINATRKAPTIAIADLLPTFPDVPVRPGSTWFTTMSFVSDLSTRAPINVKDASITFTSYENLQTPGGENRRCAKLESRFLLPAEVAKQIAANLANKSGGSGGAAAGGGAPAGAAPDATAGATGAAAGGLTADDITVARTNFARVIWFDVERRRILRAEDSIRTYYELPVAAPTAGAAPVGDFGPTGPGAAPAAPAEPQTVDYDMKVTTWLDDRVPNPTGQYQPGGAGAHLRDSVTEPGLSRILTSNVPAPTQ